MIRLRRTDGSTVELTDAFRFVEICDPDGRIAHVTYADDGGVVHTVTPASRDAARYEAMFAGAGAKFGRLVRLPEGREG